MPSNAFGAWDAAWAQGCALQAAKPQVLRGLPVGSACAGARWGHDRCSSLESEDDPAQDLALAQELLHTPVGDVHFAWTQDVEGSLVWAEITTADEPLHAAVHHGVEGVEIARAS